MILHGPTSDIYKCSWVGMRGDFIAHRRFTGVPVQEDQALSFVRSQEIPSSALKTHWMDSGNHADVSNWPNEKPCEPSFCLLINVAVHMQGSTYVLLLRWKGIYIRVGPINSLRLQWWKESNLTFCGGRERRRTRSFGESMYALFSAQRPSVTWKQLKVSLGGPWIHYFHSSRELNTVS